MPTYEYICRACDHRFEAFQKMSDEPLRDCPDCGQPDAQRQISAGGGLVFKGPGFYATDYRKGPAPKESQDKTKSDPGKGSKSSGSGKSKSK